MVVPTWQVDVSAESVSPNVRGQLEADLRMRAWVANAEHLALWPGDWDSAANALAKERELVAEADERSESAEQFEQLLTDAEAEHRDDESSPLDLGVAGLVLALNAAGFATASSCRQHVGGAPFGDCPFVYTTGDDRRIEVLLRLARDVGAGLTEGAPGEGFVVYGPTVRVLMSLAARIVDARWAFDALPQTIGWDPESYEASAD
jgi:hypothetical protein